MYFKVYKHCQGKGKAGKERAEREQVESATAQFKQQNKTEL